VTSKTNKVTHLQWAINSRSRNQTAALRLLELFVKYENLWKAQKLSRAAQDLIGVTFSLWRAAFLADKSGRRADVFDHGRLFLERLIEDNAIAYPQDKTCREWSFNYYTRSARSSLQVLNEYWPVEAPRYVAKKRNATQRWEYCQDLLDQAVAGFEGRLRKTQATNEHIADAKARRVARKKKRAIVRNLTLTAR
jgi:hypothetical protein